jgi:hypothetical protein
MISNAIRGLLVFLLCSHNRHLFPTISVCLITLRLLTTLSWHIMVNTRIDLQNAFLGGYCSNYFEFPSFDVTTKETFLDECWSK